MNSEHEKYVKIYANHPDYGKAFHGKNALDILSDAESVLDIGCGDNELCRRLSQKGILCTGIDFASNRGHLTADITEGLSFYDRHYDFVTAFDVLEHLLPEQVEPALQEMARVSHRFCFSVATLPSRDIKNLHPTVMPFEWWVETISKYASRCESVGQAFLNLHPYIVGEWNAP